MANFFTNLFRSPANEVSETEASVSTQEMREFNTDIGASYVNIVGGGLARGAPYSYKDISTMLQAPMANISALRRWAAWAYTSNGTISTAIDSLTSLHSLEYVVSTSKKRKDVSKSDRKMSIQKMHDTLRTIRYKEVIRDAILKNANAGMYVAYFETRAGSTSKKYALTDYEVGHITEISSSGMNISIIPLPLSHIRIIGRRNNCYEVAFDLRYFDGMSADELKRRLSGMPKQIQDGYAKYRKGDLDDNATWLRLDWKKTIVTKIKSGVNDPYGIPFAVAALDDVDYAKYFINTKRRVLDAVNNQVYYETFPEGKDRGTSALTGKQQEAQHKTVKEALTQRANPNGISFFSLAAGTKMDSLPVDISLLDEENENAIKEDVNKDIGFSAAALNGSSSGNYATATLNLEIVANKVFTWIESVVDELNKCINYNVIRDGSYRVDFFVLPITFINRDAQVKVLSDLYARGKGSLLAWVAASGFNTETYMSLLEYELEEDFENKFPVHKTSFTITGKDEPTSDVDHNTGGVGSNPSTESTMSNNGNASPSPSDM